MGRTKTESIKTTFPNLLSQLEQFPKTISVVNMAQFFSQYLIENQGDWEG